MKKTFKQFKWSLMLFASVCSLNATAFDLWQAYESARENDPTYLSAQAQKDVSYAQKRQARAAILPTVSLSGTAEHRRNKFLTSNYGVFTNPTTVQVTLNQPIIDIASLTAFKQVGLNVNSSQLKLKQAHQDLIIRVVQAYFTALLEQGNASIAQIKEVTAAKQLEFAKRNFEVGNTTVIDKHEAEAAYYNARAEAISALSAKSNALSALEDLVGHSISEPLAPLDAPLTLKMPVPDSQEQWVARARKENYAVLIAKLSDEIAQIEIRRRKQQYLPKLNLVASHEWKHTNINHDNDSNTRNSSVGAQLTMPLFDGGLISAQVDEAQALQKQSMQAVRSADATVAQATRTAYSQAVSGLSTIHALESARKASSASVAANSVGYKLGMRINIDVLNAQNTDAQTQYNLAQAQYNTIIGNVNLKAAVAQLDESDVRFINSLLSLKQSNKKLKATTALQINAEQDSKPASKTASIPELKLKAETPLTIKPEDASEFHDAF